MKLPSPVERHHSRIEIIPLIDIMFFLLASFMMVSLQLDRTHNVKVNLPDATQAKHDFKPDMLNIAVDKDGDAYVEKKKITLPDLGTLVSNRFKVNTNLPVYISGDAAAREGAIQDVLERVRNAGVQKVAFMIGGNEAANPATNAP